MGYSPYDWNENIQHRADYVETRLRQGSPVAGRAYDRGLLLLSVRKSQRKVFEVFDHILFSAMGSQSDVEAIRIASIDFAHQEGFNRSPDDVSVQRLVAGLSPTFKKAFADAFGTPFVVRGIFAELGRDASRDQFTTFNYDGEYAVNTGWAAAGGSAEAENRMKEVLERGEERPDLESAVRQAAEAWAEGRAAAMQVQTKPGWDRDNEEEDDVTRTPHGVLEEALKDGQLEVGVLERAGRESRFRLLSSADLDRIRRGA